MSTDDRGKFIVDIADEYINLTEKRGNLGWNDPDLERRMVDVGWQSTWAWCALFTEMIWMESYPDSRLMRKVITKLSSASATATYANFDKESRNPNSTIDVKVCREPVAGAIVVWRYGTSWKGHCGIVECYDKGSKVFTTIEGNTGLSGSREGDGVFNKTRDLDFDTHKSKGLNLLGFIHPPKLKEQ